MHGFGPGWEHLGVWIPSKGWFRLRGVVQNVTIFIEYWIVSGVWPNGLCIATPKYGQVESNNVGFLGWAEQFGPPARRQGVILTVAT